MEQEELRKLQEYITLKSDVLGLDSGLISNTSELRALTRLKKKSDQNYPERLSSGWRQEFLAEML
jgi:hypothetical protein